MAKVAQLTIENDWLEKNLNKSLGMAGRLKLVIKDHELSVSRQCELLEINRTSVYYTPAQPDWEFKNLVKDRLDYWHTRMPYIGVRKLRDKLQNFDNIPVERKPIKRFMNEMGIYAMCPKPNLSKRNIFTIGYVKVQSFLLFNRAVYRGFSKFFA